MFTKRDLTGLLCTTQGMTIYPKFTPITATFHSKPRNFTKYFAQLTIPKHTHTIYVYVYDITTKPTPKNTRIFIIVKRELCDYSRRNLKLPLKQ